jgi:hypothetical protein
MCVRKSGDYFFVDYQFNSLAAVIGIKLDMGKQVERYTPGIVLRKQRLLSK